MNKERVTQLQQWYRTEIGQSLLQQEKKVLASELQLFQGKHILFMGDWIFPDAFSNLSMQF